MPTQAEQMMRQIRDGLPYERNTHIVEIKNTTVSLYYLMADGSAFSWIWNCNPERLTEISKDDFNRCKARPMWKKSGEPESE